jgi:hypothetical protein
MNYDVAVCYIAYGYEVTLIFKTKTGAKKGVPSSSKLYNAYIADIVAKINEVQEGVIIGDIKLNIIIYVDQSFGCNFFLFMILNLNQYLIFLNQRC